MIIDPNNPQRRAVPHSRHSLGFSLVEILIVVVILGILAAIAVPKFSNASQLSKENSIREDLRLIRTQIGVYRAQHNDAAPGFPSDDSTQTPTEASFAAQMTLYSDADGDTSAVVDPNYALGPYLNNIPPNPINGLTSVKVVGATDQLSSDGTTGWLYQPATATFKPNLATLDSAGESFDSY